MGELLLALVVLMLATSSADQPLQPTHPIPLHPSMCTNSLSPFRFLFLCDKCCSSRQIPYGERKRLVLQLLVLQPCMEGVLLGVPTKVLDIDTVFLSMGSFMLNFLIISTSSTPIKCYENTQKLPLLDMRGQLCMMIMLGWVLVMVTDMSHLSSGLCK